MTTNGTPPDALAAAYAGLKAEATRLAGAPGDIPRRVALLHAIHVDSGGNHAFPEVALHGAAWALTFFETTGRLGQMIRHRYFYDAEQRAYRMGLLGRFAEAFKTANRAVFIDTFTNYYFTKAHGRESGAEGLLPAPLLAALNEVHAAAARGQRLSAAARRDLFLAALRFEQEVTVAPAVKAEVARFDCPVLTYLCLKPVVRFAYFPRWRYMFFRDFSDTDERIDKATESFDLAERGGWGRVAERIAEYGVVPGEVLSDPVGHAARLRRAAVDPQSS
jgi:hypothetical protein